MGAEVERPGRVRICRSRRRCGIGGHIRGMGSRKVYCRWRVNWISREWGYGLCRGNGSGVGQYVGVSGMGKDMEEAHNVTSGIQVACGVGEAKVSIIEGLEHRWVAIG